jgi:putative Holliday junction resolvase
LSDALRLTAQPYDVVDLTTDDLADTIHAILADHDVDLIVVGLPVALSGAEGSAAAAAREFGAEVAAMSDLPVEFCDERFTTVVAERALLEAGARRKKRKGVRDKVAAAVMLQDYLDRGS